MQVMRIVERHRDDLQRLLDLITLAPAAQADTNRIGRVAVDREGGGRHRARPREPRCSANSDGLHAEAVGIGSHR
ncbi:hypothetical protein CF68_06310 [Cupriavidus sp. SK-4]|nr:hypothetical protein CF68_06310 [Cupriavidus sp. SK-4]